MTAPQQAGIPPQIQQQLQQVSSQKMQYEMTLRETKRALEEIGSAADDAVMYSAVGSILIQKPKTAVKAELEEKVDSLELRVNSMDKQEKAMAAKATQLQKQIQEAISTGIPAAQ